MKRGTPDHPKTLRLMQELQLSQREVVGMLELLWNHWAPRYAPRGDVGRWSDEAIAAAMDYPGEPRRLVATMVQVRFFDFDKTYRLLIHDWPEHCDQSVRKWLARNGLRFATLSGRRPDKVRPVSGLPLPLPLPLPVPMPTDNPPTPLLTQGGGFQQAGDFDLPPLLTEGNGRHPAPSDTLRAERLAAERRIKDQVEQARVFCISNSGHPGRQHLRLFKAWFKAGWNLAQVQEAIERGEHKRPP